jgi:uncharacterized RDD family membrane protein YckC
MFCSKCGSVVADGTLFCAACGQPVAGAPSAPIGSAPVASQPATASARRPVVYAGFWLRFVAAIIDSLVLGIPFGALFFALMFSSLPALMRMQGQDPMMIIMTILPRLLLILLISLVASWLYWAGMESSEWQATLGKKALGLYVTDLEDRRATFGKTSGRFFAGRGIGSIPYLGGLYYLISCITAGFTERKQAVHDMIAGCLVLRKI